MSLHSLIHYCSISDGWFLLKQNTFFLLVFFLGSLLFPSKQSTTLHNTSHRNSQVANIQIPWTKIHKILHHTFSFNPELYTDFIHMQISILLNSMQLQEATFIYVCHIFESWAGKCLFASLWSMSSELWYINVVITCKHSFYTWPGSFYNYYDFKYHLYMCGLNNALDYKCECPFPLFI